METADQIAAAVMAWTVANSGHQEHRDYIGLSHAAQSIEDLLASYRNGFAADNAQKRKYYKGYQMEADLVRRLGIVFGDRVQRGEEISAFDGFVKGHPDFRFDGWLGDCKTVPLDEHLPEPAHLPRRVFWQLQAYMLYAPAEKSLVIYESRETGLLRAFWLHPVRAIQNQINEKFESVVAKIKQSK